MILKLWFNNAIFSHFYFLVISKKGWNFIKRALKKNWEFTRKNIWKVEILIKFGANQKQTEKEERERGSFSCHNNQRWWLQRRRSSPSPPPFPLYLRRFLASDSLRQDPLHLLVSTDFYLKKMWKKTPFLSQENGWLQFLNFLIFFFFRIELIPNTQLWWGMRIYLRLLRNYSWRWDLDLGHEFAIDFALQSSLFVCWWLLLCYLMPLLFDYLPKLVFVCNKKWKWKWKWKSAAASMATNVDPIKEWILSEGKATQITGTRPVGGGCINRAYRYETDVGSFFVKTNRYRTPMNNGRNQELLSSFVQNQSCLVLFDY